MKDLKPRCTDCSRYCGYMADNGTVYGCSNPEDPEPYDPEFYCKRCSKKEYLRMKKDKSWQKEGVISCYWWVKPEWYTKAIYDAGFILTVESHKHSLKSRQ